MAKSQFEGVFDKCVEEFGGERVPEEPEHGERSADYVFRAHSVIAELKGLVVDQAAGMSEKLDEIIESRRAAGVAVASPVESTYQMLPFTSTETGEKFFLPYDEAFQRAWTKVLLTPIESIIRDANRQIRATKERLAMPQAHGIVIIANEGNPVHAVGPVHFARLAGEVIQKPQAGERRFPHIDGLVYLSLEVTTRDPETQKDMPFWLGAQVRGHASEAVKRFQEELKAAWYRYVEKIRGAPVVSHHRETGWPQN